jgi:hypothetical protein
MIKSSHLIIFQNVHSCISVCKVKEEKQVIFLLALSGAYLPPLAKSLITLMLKALPNFAE